MRAKKILRTVMLLLICLVLSGCRTRTGAGRQKIRDSQNRQAENISLSYSGFSSEDEADQDSDPAEPEKNEEPGGQTRENPEASRKEYDENRPAEILPGTDRIIYESGEGNGFSASGEGAEQSAVKLSEDAEETAIRTIAAEEAEQSGVSEGAEEADSALTYFSVLLQERMGALFECQRLNVYWETTEDHVTVYKTSPEHYLILNAGAYDVSARLLEGNLRVDDGWISRKNPGIIVKMTDRNVLGTGVVSAEAARAVYNDLLGRDGWLSVDAVRNKRILLISEELLEAPHLQLAAMLLIAKTASPDLFTDVNIDQALEMLGEEMTGSIPHGIYYFNDQGGS